MSPTIPFICEFLVTLGTAKLLSIISCFLTLFHIRITRDYAPFVIFIKGQLLLISISFHVERMRKFLRQFVGWLQKQSKTGFVLLCQPLCFLDVNSSLSRVKLKASCTFCCIFNFGRFLCKRNELIHKTKFKEQHFLR